jgi:TolB protein
MKPVFLRIDLLSWLLKLLILSTLAVPAWAQFRVEVTGVGMTQLPVVIAPFKGEATAPQKLASIVQADLERSGQFKGLAAGSASMDETSRPDWTPWRQLSAEALVAGSVTRLADGRFDVRARLWDVVKGQEKSDFKDTVSAADLRLSALSSPEPIISPSWSPSGAQLAYVSFELRKPVVYVHELATGQRRPVANFKGSNSAPAWSADGKSLAATLSRDGGSQLFRIDLNGGEPRRLTTSGGINTEPAFSPDGSALFFVSDRGGSPQIYRMPAQGGPAERVTFSGTYNISPVVSPDGRWLAYVSRMGGAFRLHLMELASGQVTALTDTSADERPSFAPNSRLLVYATIFQGRESLMTTTLDGRIKARLAGQGGDIREPHWGPVRK